MPLPVARGRRAATPIIGCVAGCVAVALTAGACSSSGPASGGSSSSGSSSSTGTHAAAKHTDVTITAAKGCQLDATTFAAGGITFDIQNKDATAVSEVELLSGERILAEKENIPAGLGGQFAVKVDAGTYTVYCPGAPTERQTIKVVGKASAVDDNVAALLKTGAAQYKTYVDTQIGYLVQGTGKLAAAIAAGNLAAAQAAYIAARPFYEKVESVAESFVNGRQNLDSDIDARVNDVPAGHWYGFHRIEKGLFQDKSLSGLAPFSTKLVKDVATLQAKAKTLTYQATDLANGAQGLLDEVAGTKITGEEERYSHIDMVDMANNIEGAEQAFADIQPGVAKIDANLAQTVATQFSALDTAVQKYRTQSNPSGYVYYPALSDADRRSLAAAVKAVAEPLSRVIGKIANA